MGRWAIVTPATSSAPTGCGSPTSRGPRSSAAGIRDAFARQRPFTTGRSYINFQTSDEGREQVRASYGSNFGRLLEVKRRYDPDNLFRSNRNIEGDERPGPSSAEPCSWWEVASQALRWPAPSATAASSARWLRRALDRRRRELGINLPANATRALAAVGIGDEVLDLGRRIDRREYRSSAGRLLFSVEEGAFWGDVGTSVCLRRTDLIDLLVAAVTPGRIRWDAMVTRVTPSGDTVVVDFATGPAGEYDYVVGADGVHSAVRASVDPHARLRPSRMAGASWRFLTVNPGVPCWTVWTGSRGTILLIPIGDGEVYGFASATRGGDAGADSGWLSTTFAGFPAAATIAISSALRSGGQLFHSPVDEVRAVRWSRGRITLIGDAAHAMGPIWAQGAALALEDALVLADLLATSRDWTTVGTAVEKRRKPRVDHVAAATDRMARLARLPSWLLDLFAPSAGPRAYRAAYGPLRQPATAATARRPPGDHR